MIFSKTDTDYHELQERRYLSVCSHIHCAQEWMQEASCHNDKPEVMFAAMKELETSIVHLKRWIASAEAHAKVKKWNKGVGK